MHSATRRDSLLRSPRMDLLRHLAFTLAGAGRHAEAAWHAARACELKPYDPRTWSDRGCVHCAMPFCWKAARIPASHWDGCSPTVVWSTLRSRASRGPKN